MYKLSAAIAMTGALLLAGCDGPAWMGFAAPEVQAIKPSDAYLDARMALLQSAQDRDPVTRANAVEALASTLGAEAGEVCQQGLIDPLPVVRFASAMAIGDVKYAPALPTLRRMVQDNKAEPKLAEPDKRVFCALIYALHALGDDSKTGELATLLFDEQPEVRMDAAMAMGKMGAVSAIGPLNSVLSNEREEAVKIQLTESLAMLGDSRSAEVLEAFTKGYYLDIRLLAITAIGRTGSERAIRVLKELTADREPARVRVKSAGELARLGFSIPDMLTYCLRAIREPAVLLEESGKVSRRAADSDADSLKLLAIIATGFFGDEKIVNDLHGLLKDQEGPIRVAAAASILRLLKGYKPLTAPAATTPVEVPPAAPLVPAAPASPVIPAAPASAPVVGDVPEVRLAPVAPEVSPAPEGPTTRPQIRSAGGKD
jgi:HEAT repeat protein